jgi:hypothetical protein
MTYPYRPDRAACKGLPEKGTATMVAEGLKSPIRLRQFVIRP